MPFFLVIVIVIVNYPTLVAVFLFNRQGKLGWCTVVVEEVVCYMAVKRERELALSREEMKIVR